MNNAASMNPPVRLIGDTDREPPFYFPDKASLVTRNRIFLRFYLRRWIFPREQTLSIYAGMQNDRHPVATFATNESTERVSFHVTLNERFEITLDFSVIGRLPRLSRRFSTGHGQRKQTNLAWVCF